MCSICNHYPCLSSCPNAPDPEPTITCFQCGLKIEPGEEYWTGEENLCMVCAKDVPAEELGNIAIA